MGLQQRTAQQEHQSAVQSHNPEENTPLAGSVETAWPLTKMGFDMRS